MGQKTEKKSGQDILKQILLVSLNIFPLLHKSLEISCWNNESSLVALLIWKSYHMSTPLLINIHNITRRALYFMIDLMLKLWQERFERISFEISANKKDCIYFNFGKINTWLNETVDVKSVDSKFSDFRFLCVIDVDFFFTQCVVHIFVETWINCKMEIYNTQMHK